MLYNVEHASAGTFIAAFYLLFINFIYFPLHYFRYINSSTGLVTTGFVDFAVCNQATAANTFDKLDEKMKIYDINWSNCIAFSSDNASVMMGKHNSIYKRISELSPHVYPVGCACHLTHLCASKAAKELSVDVEQLVIDLYYYFDKSSKRKEILKEYQQFCNVETRKILKHSSTRWLSLMKSVHRILLTYDALCSYFASSEEVSKAKKGSSPATLMERLADPMTKVYILFVHSVMPVFDSFTALLECEEPMIHKLSNCITKLVRDLLGRFISIKCIHEADSYLEIEYEDPSVQLSDEQLRVGFATRQFIHKFKDDLEGTPYMTKFYREVRNFFITALNYVKMKFPHSDDVVQNAFVLDVARRSEVDIGNVNTLLERFPGLIKDDDLTNLESEFLDYQLLSNKDLPYTSVEMADGRILHRRIDEVWFEISKMKDIVTGKQRFPVLCTFMSAISFTTQQC